MKLRLPAPGGDFPSEAGGAVVELAVALPLVFAVLCGVVDCGRLAACYAAVDNAAYAACRTLAEDPFQPAGDVAAAAAAASPSIASAPPEVEAVRGPERIEGYVHHLPSGEGFTDRGSNRVTREVSARVSVDLEPATFVGEALAHGSGGTIRVSAEHSSLADTTTGEGGESRW